MATTQRELIELVQQHFPERGEVEVRRMLDRAQDEICAETEALENFISITTVAGTRFYEPPVDIITIRGVEMEDEDGNYYQIPRIQPRISSNGG